MAAAVPLYGVGIVSDKPDLPHLLLDEIKSELYCVFAEHDLSVPAEVALALGDTRARTDVKSTARVFPSAHHGFWFVERPVYDTLAAEFDFAHFRVLGRGGGSPRRCLQQG